MAPFKRDRFRCSLDPTCCTINIPIPAKSILNTVEARGMISPHVLVVVSESTTLRSLNAMLSLIQR